MTRQRLSSLLMMVGLITTGLMPAPLPGQTPLPDQPDQQETSITRKAFSDGTVVTATLPEAVLDLAPACHQENCIGLLLLTHSGQKPSLSLLDPFEPGSPSGAPRPIDVELPQKANTLAVIDINADGHTDVLVSDQSQLVRIGTLGERFEPTAPQVLMESPDLRLGGLTASGLLTPGQLAAPELRSLKIFIARPNGDLALASEHDLPLRASRQPTGLRLYSYPVTGLQVDGRTLFAVGPEAHGDHRMRTILIEPGAEGEKESEAWSSLPAAEKIIDSWYAALNGRPALIVTTVQADKLGLFEKKKLRVFSLRAGDRSRSGSGPSLKVQTASHRWQQANPSFVDIDGDGFLDMVLVQPEGLGGKKLIVEGYLGRSNAQFQLTPLRGVIQAKSPDAWHYGADVDGDGIADLVTRSEDLLQVFRGVRDRKKKQILNKKPHWAIELASGGQDSVEVTLSLSDGDASHVRRSSKSLEVTDLNGDGRSEILILGHDEKTSRVQVVIFMAPSIR